jgi:hypothetical protein
VHDPLPTQVGLPWGVPDRLTSVRPNRGIVSDNPMSVGLGIGKGTAEEFLECSVPEFAPSGLAARELLAARLPGQAQGAWVR